MNGSLPSLDGVTLLSIIEKIDDAIALCNSQKNILFSNSKFAQIHEVNVDDLMGKNIFVLKPELRITTLHEVIMKCISTQQLQIQINFCAVDKIWKIIKCLPIENSQYIIVISALGKEQSNNYFKDINTLDILTSLGNRFAFEQDFKKLISLDVKFSAALIDINRFRIINEVLGFEIGDMVLVEISARLKEKISFKNKIYRLGTDQFLILNIEGVDNFENMLKETLNTFNPPIIYNQKEISLNATCGYIINHIQDIETTPFALLKKLEITLLNAKKLKTNLLEYSSALDNIKNYFEMEKDLRKALLEDEFEIYYQPQCDMMTGKIYGAEALLRWNHPIKGMMNPMDFLPLAEELNLMKEIDQWVFKKVTNQYKTLSNINSNLAISINLSADSMSSSQIVEIFEKYLLENDAKRMKMTFEITETSVMTDVEKSKEVISNLINRGSKIAIDDFGTGYCSMEYLIKYPSDYLKIDREFIKEIASSKAHKIMVLNMIQMGHNLGMKIVAEGVETQVELDLLKEMKCDVIQGYFYGKPMSFARFKEFLL